MCIKREPHEILQPIADLVAELPLLLSRFAFAHDHFAYEDCTPHRATNGAFAGLNAYYATTENV